jgi:hypothetical protein
MLNFQGIHLIDGDGMTLCIAVKCEDGILIASDSRTIYGHGVPISRDTNKIHNPYIRKGGSSEEEGSVSWRRYGGFY